MVLLRAFSSRAKIRDGHQHSDRTFVSRDSVNQNKMPRLAARTCEVGYRGSMTRIFSLGFNGLMARMENVVFNLHLARILGLGSKLLMARSRTSAVSQ
jgi:hypothetical protein